MQDRSPHGPLSPGAFTLGTAIDGSPPLARLLQRLQDSRARLAAVRGLLPESLREQVRPGPLDDKGWSLLVANGAAASKLRQLVPALEAALLAQGLAAATIRIRVQAR